MAQATAVDLQRAQHDGSSDSSLLATALPPRRRARLHLPAVQQQRWIADVKFESLGEYTVPLSLAQHADFRSHSERSID